MAWPSLFISVNRKKKPVTFKKAKKYLPAVFQIHSCPARCLRSWQCWGDEKLGGGDERDERWAPKSWPWEDSMPAAWHWGWTVAVSSGRIAGRWCHQNLSQGPPLEGWWSRVRGGWNHWFGITKYLHYYIRVSFNNEAVHMKKLNHTFLGEGETGNAEKGWNQVT